MLTFFNPQGIIISHKLSKRMRSLLKLRTFQDERRHENLHSVKIFWESNIKLHTFRK